MAQKIPASYNVTAEKFEHNSTRRKDGRQPPTGDQASVSVHVAAFPVVLIAEYSAASENTPNMSNSPLRDSHDSDNDREEMSTMLASSNHIVAQREQDHNDGKSAAAPRSSMSQNPAGRPNSPNGGNEMATSRQNDDGPSRFQLETLLSRLEALRCWKSETRDSGASDGPPCTSESSDSKKCDEGPDALLSLLPGECPPPTDEDSEKGDALSDTEHSTNPASPTTPPYEYGDTDEEDEFVVGNGMQLL